MKKHILYIVSILSVFACLAGLANAGIEGSKHDLTAWSGYGNFRGENDEICIYCHTPHNGVSDDRGTRLPLWNRTLNVNQGFTMYSNPGSLQATMPVDGPTGFSLLCLSCHDGVSTLGTIINNSQGSADITFDPVNATLGMSFPGYVDVNISRDLSNDHPVSFVYDAALVSADQTANGVLGLANPDPATLAPLKLAPGSRLECTTCHDAHNNANSAFLRMSNTGSAMCRKCHLK
jgi:predicted CXXCH cytochrome family protein